MKKLIVCILLFIFHIFYCQWIFAATEEAWFPDEIDIHYEPEKGMVVQTGDYEIDMKNKIFVKENNIMIPVKEIIDIGMREKNNTMILEEYEKAIADFDKAEKLSYYEIDTHCRKRIY